MLTNPQQSSNIKVVIKGAGGHGLVVADLLLEMHRCHGGVEPVGFIDDDPLLEGKTFMGLEVFGSDYRGIKDRSHAVIVAIGDNRIRKEVIEHLEKEGAILATGIHPNAIAAKNASIGAGTMICAGAILNPATQIRTNVILNTGCTVDHHNIVGDYVHIAPGVNLGGEVHVGEGALLGVGASVLPGRKIGPWSIIGGGAVVTRDVPVGMIRSGVPAKHK